MRQAAMIQHIVDDRKVFPLAGEPGGTGAAQIVDRDIGQACGGADLVPLALDDQAERMLGPVVEFGKTSRSTFEVNLKTTTDHSVSEPMQEWPG